jgi:hypothetical protein
VGVADGWRTAQTSISPRRDVAECKAVVASLRDPHALRYASTVGSKDGARDQHALIRAMPARHWGLAWSRRWAVTPPRPPPVRAYGAYPPPPNPRCARIAMFVLVCPVENVWKRAGARARE